MEETQTGHWRCLATALCQGQPAGSWQAHSVSRPPADGQAEALTSMREKCGCCRFLAARAQCITPWELGQLTTASPAVWF